MTKQITKQFVFPAPAPQMEGKPKLPPQSKPSGFHDRLAEPATGQKLYHPQALTQVQGYDRTVTTPV
jgi:hypothetical protein